MYEKNSARHSRGGIVQLTTILVAVVISVSMLFAGILTGSMQDAQAAQAKAPSFSDSFPAPVPVYTEDFENNVAASGAPSNITDYRSAGGATRYTAGGAGPSTNLQGKSVYYWQDPNVCNGFIASGNNQISLNSIKNEYCGGNSSDGQNGGGSTWGSTDGDYAAVRAKAFALATDASGNFVNNGRAVGNMTNHALSTNTSGGQDANVPGDMFIIPDASAIDVSNVHGRFINFAVDAATTGCPATNFDGKSPLLQFTMKQIGAHGSSTTLLNPTSINTCDLSALGDSSTVDVSEDPNFKSNKVNDNGSMGSEFSQTKSWITQVTRGKVYGSQAVLLGSDTTKLGLSLHNFSTASSQGGANTVIRTWGRGTANGNDGAIDNIRILDVTPRLTKSFSPQVTSIGATSRLTITVNNRSDNATKDGWAFTDTLPAGLKFAADPKVGGTCLAAPNAATVTADQNKNALVVKKGKLGGAGAGQTLTSCTIQADVTSTTAALYSNGQANMSEQIGVDGPATPATVKFTKGSVRWQKIDSQSKKALAGSQWQISRTDANLPTGSRDENSVNPTVNTSFNIDDTGSESTSQVGSTDDYTKDSDSGAGFLAVQYLPWGTYNLIETKAPDGYKPSTTTYSFTIGAGGLTVDGNTVISDPVALSGDGMGNSQVPNDKLEQAVCRADSPNLYNQYSRQEPSGSGRFVNKLQRYDLSQNGAVTDLADVSSQVTRETNGLGISGDGRYFYFVDFDIASVSDPHIYQYDAQTGKVKTFNAASNGTWNDNGKVRRGGVDLHTGIYYYSTTQMDGSTATNVNNLYALNPVSGVSWYVGTVVTAFPGQSGDLTFDDQGNMYFVVGNNSTAYVNVYSGRQLPTSPNASPISVRTQFLNQVGNTGNGVGIAYGNGWLYTSNTNGDFYQVDPSTGQSTQLTGMSIPPNTGNSSRSGLSVDLSTCSSPNTLTVKKDYPKGRSDPNDNVTLSAWRNTSSQVGQSVDTNGPATGVQTQQLGPVPILIGNNNSYSVREEAKTDAGSKSLAAYDTSYSCVDENDSSWTKSSAGLVGDVARSFDLGQIPPTRGAKARAIVCTITNVPISGSVVWSKSGEDGTLLSGSEWRLSGTKVPGASGTIVTDCASPVCPTSDYSDQDSRPGIFKLDSLPFGNYVLVESKAPAGFVLDGTQHTFTIDAAHREVSLNDGKPFINKQRTPPVLPLTGGLSSDAFVWGGAALVLLSAGLSVVWRRRMLRFV